jgi:hypothetical protein
VRSALHITLKAAAHLIYCQTRVRNALRNQCFWIIHLGFLVFAARAV